MRRYIFGKVANAIVPDKNKLFKKVPWQGRLLEQPLSRKHLLQWTLKKSYLVNPADGIILDHVQVHLVTTQAPNQSELNHYCVVRSYLNWP